MHDAMLLSGCLTVGCFINHKPVHKTSEVDPLALTGVTVTQGPSGEKITTGKSVRYWHTKRHALGLLLYWSDPGADLRSCSDRAVMLVFSGGACWGPSRWRTGDQLQRHKGYWQWLFRRCLCCKSQSMASYGARDAATVWGGRGQKR